MRRIASMLLLGLALGSPTALLAKHHDRDKHERDRYANQRYYDPYRRDYHEWNEQEDRAYRRYLEEQRREYRDYEKLNRKQQRDYWKWRHEHADLDDRR